jgi:hypothetical protein
VNPQSETIVEYSNDLTGRKPVSISMSVALTILKAPVERPQKLTVKIKLNKQKHHM